jgi:hypothetical protein
LKIRSFLVINSELSKENKRCDESAIRRYIQSGKNTYENAILSGVAEGIYLATVQDTEIAYKVTPPSEKEVDEIIDMAKVSAASGKANLGIPTEGQVVAAIKNARAAKLSHALNMITMWKNRAKLGVAAETVSEG